MYKGLNVETVEKFLNFFVKCFSIDESRALHKNYSFWFALLTPAIIALLLGLNLTRELVMHERFDFGFTAVHLDSFIKYYKFPIGLLPISILLSVMVARFHASKQTVQQTHLKNYFEHYSFFESFCKTLEIKYDAIIDTRALYLLFYKESSLEEFKPLPNKELLDSFKNILQDMLIDVENEYTFGCADQVAHKDHIIKFEVNVKFSSHKNFYVWTFLIQDILIDLYSFQGNRIRIDTLVTIERFLKLQVESFTSKVFSKFPQLDTKDNFDPREEF
ncbi:MAG: hypothetical protein ACI87I_000418 [Pseudoalteromonas tetraodonis]|jgi:hypothetical protein